MKKLLTVLFMLLFTVVSGNLMADPIAQGNVVLGFSDLLKYESYSGDLYKGADESYFTFNGGTGLSAQYFVINGLAVGGSISYEVTKSDAAPGETEKETWWAIGPMVSYYLPINPKLLASVSAFYILGKIKRTVNGVGSFSSDITTYGLGADINYMLTNFLALTAGVSYSFDNEESTGFDEDGNTLAFTAGFKIFF